MDSGGMFYRCTALKGGMGTTYDEDHTDVEYAHIDGGTANPGYLTSKSAVLLGDVDGDGHVNVTDVTMLITAVINETFSSIIVDASDLDGNGLINVTDVTMLITLVINN